MDFGIVTIAYGKGAVNQAAALERSLHHTYGGDVLPIHLVDEGKINDYGNAGRWAKVNLYDLSPFKYTLYMDADTRVYQPLDALIAAIWHHEFVATFSQAQGANWAWHVNEREREPTRTLLGHTPVQWQGGVFGFQKTARVELFFETWKAHYQEYPQAADQVAMMRALHDVPLQAWFMGRAWNGGDAIGHQHGSIE